MTRSSKYCPESSRLAVMKAYIFPLNKYQFPLLKNELWAYKISLTCFFSVLKKKFNFI